MNIKKEVKESIEKAGSPASLTTESFLHYSKNYAVLKQSDSIKSLIQGKIYTFYYDSFLKEKKSFINKRPVIFFDTKEIDMNHSIIKGIDLILMTPRDRLNFFIRLNFAYGKIIEQNEKKEISSRMPLRFDSSILDTLMTGINYKYAYSAYKLEKIKGLKEIPQEEWKYLIYLNTRSIEGIDLNDIYNKYK